MTTPSEPAERAGRESERAKRRLRRICTAAVVFVAAVAVADLVGWAVGSRDLVRLVPVPGGGAMMPLTAVALGLGAIALGLLRDAPPWRSGRGVAGAASALVTLLVGALVLAEYVSGVDLGIDLLLFPEPVRRLTPLLPGRPAPETALCFTLTGAALLMLDVELGRRRRPAQLLAITVAFLALVTLTGYGYGEPSLFAPSTTWFPTFTPMALHTALAFVALSAGILFARPDRGIMAVFTGPDVAGYIARRLLPVAIFVPLALGWLRLAGERAQLFSAAFGTALLVVAVIGVMTGVIGRSAGALKSLEAARTAADAALRESEARFRAIFERAGIGITLAGPGGVILACNAAFEAMLGYAPGELVGVHFTDFTHRDHVLEDRAIFEELVHGERDRYQVEKRYIRKDGGIVWARLTVSLVSDEDGSPRYAIGMIEDITERKRAEEARRRLAEILAATPDWVGTAAPDGQVTYINRAWRRIFGLGDDDDVSHLTIADAHPPWAARAILQEGIPAAMRDGWWTGETAIVTVDGREIPASQTILVHRRPDGAVEAISTILRDVTERKRREEGQRFLAQVSRALVASLDEAQTLAAVARLVVADHADACLLYFCREPGRPVLAASEHRRPEHRALVERLGAVVVAGGSARLPSAVCHGESSLITDITPAWLNAIARDEDEARALAGLAGASAVFVPLHDGDRVSGLMGQVRFEPVHRFDGEDLALTLEVADRLSLALENSRLFRESEAATRLRDEVLRVVAHDLRSPIATISLTAGMLLEEESCAESRSDIEVIERSAVRASRLIEDLLDVARMQAGRLSVRTERLEAGPLVGETVALHRPQAQDKTLTLDAEVAEALPPIQGDRDRLLQVFSNLIGNALRFTPASGRVVVRAAPDDAGVRFSVCDTGPGIPREQWPMLFDPFWQASQGSRKGAGLGLAIVKGLVEAHGGRIWVESGEGQGTTFHFTVPAAT